MAVKRFLSLSFGASTALDSHQTINLTLGSEYIAQQELEVASISCSALSRPDVKLTVLAPTSLRDVENTCNVGGGAPAAYLVVNNDPNTVGAPALTDYNIPVPWIAYRGQTQLRFDTLKVRVTAWDNTALTYTNLLVQLVGHTTMSLPYPSVRDPRVAMAGDQNKLYNIMGM